jgi:hypothetical protein
MFKRKIETELKDWKKSLSIKKKAFVLKGFENSIIKTIKL